MICKGLRTHEKSEDKIRVNVNKITSNNTKTNEVGDTREA